VTKVKRLVAQAVRAQRRDDPATAKRLLELAIARMEELDRMFAQEVKQTIEARD
jgi:hypothetical protein